MVTNGASSVVTLIFGLPRAREGGDVFMSESDKQHLCYFKISSMFGLGCHIEL